MSEKENSDRAAAEARPSALRFALFWFGIPLLVFLVLAYFTHG